MREAALEFIAANERPPTLRDALPLEKVKGILVDGQWMVVGATSSGGPVEEIVQWGGLGFEVRLRHGYREFYLYSRIAGFAWQTDD